MKLFAYFCGINKMIHKTISYEKIGIIDSIYDLVVVMW